MQARAIKFPRTRLAPAVAAVVALTMLALPTAAPARQATASKDGRPNVVVIMTDDQDFRSMGVMPKTRHLIARRGTTFATASVSYPLCCPSRATYYTGQYAHNHGVTWNFFPQGGYYKFKGAETLPVWLRRAGYRTIHIGKYLNEYGERDPREVPPGLGRLARRRRPVDIRLLRLHAQPKRPAKDLSAAARGTTRPTSTRALPSGQSAPPRRRGKPFFLNVAPNAPHTLSVASGARMEGLPAVPPPRYADRFAATPLPRYPNFDEADVSDKPAFLPVLWPRLTPVQIEGLTAHYRGRMGALLGVDDLVERVVEALKRNGVYGNTDIIFTSDNGWILGEHRLIDPMSEDGRASGVKFFPYEGSSPRAADGSRSRTSRCAGR